MGKRHYNGLKTFVLLGGMWMLLLMVGAAISNGTGSPVWLWGFAAFGLISTAVSYWNSAKLALKSMNAYPASPQQYPQLHAIVNELAMAAGKPVPSIWIAPTMTPNAFATGRNPANAAVCCTEGILQILNERELRGVLGHELMHVYNRDILTSSVAAAIAGVISTVAQSLMFFGGAHRDNNGGSAAGMFLVALAAPLVSGLIRFAISRTREFDADEDGARLTNDPLALASALRKLEMATDHVPMQPTRSNEGVAAMMIANPFRLSGMRHLMATHPPMEQRIHRLETMAGYHQNGTA